ncbi:MAG: flagellar motor switch protein FliN [Phycisphaerales bacterium]|nr:flagellar motor switch protein FliN [Phycisphaerales bacterium]
MAAAIAEERAARGSSSSSESPAVDVKAFDLPDFGAAKIADATQDISILRDVDLKVHIELGRTMMFIEDVLKLSEGSVVELDNLAGDPVDVYVNDRLVAHGEVLVLNDNFCVRVNEIVTGPQRVSVA